MANGTAGKRIESLVPRKTSCRLASNCLRQLKGTFDTRVRSDFFLNEEDDMLWAVLPCRLWLNPLPFSKSQASCEAMLILQQNLCCYYCKEKLVMARKLPSFFSVRFKGRQIQCMNRGWIYSCMDLPGSFIFWILLVFAETRAILVTVTIIVFRSLIVSVTFW